MADEIKDGGPAFPRPASKGINYLTGEEEAIVDPQRGMSLRDWFAGMALQGMLSDSHEQANKDILFLSESAYGYADAMLRVRAKK